MKRIAHCGTSVFNRTHEAALRRAYEYENLWQQCARNGWPELYNPLFNRLSSMFDMEDA